MTALDVFAIVVLFILGFAVIAAWIVLGMMPGKIAARRSHPNADAIRVCGWWGVITLGLLLPLAYIWAYTAPGHEPESPPEDDESPSDVS